VSLFRTLLLLKAGGGKKVTGTGSGYFDGVGTIWMQEQGGYEDRLSGTGMVYIETPTGWGGCYFNR